MDGIPYRRERGVGQGCGGVGGPGLAGILQPADRLRSASRDRLDSTPTRKIEGKRGHGELDAITNFNECAI